MPKQDGKGRKREKIKTIVSFRFVPTRGIRDNSKKIVKKFKNLKNPVITSFPTKISWKRLTKGENKNYRFVLFLPDG